MIWANKLNISIKKKKERKTKIIKIKKVEDGSWAAAAQSAQFSKTKSSLSARRIFEFPAYPSEYFPPSHFYLRLPPLFIFALGPHYNSDI